MVISGIVKTAKPCAKDELKKLELHFSKVLEQEVFLDQIIDPEIIGGFRVEIQSHVYDASIKTRLENLKEHLKKA